MQGMWIWSLVGELGSHMPGWWPKQNRTTPQSILLPFWVVSLSQGHGVGRAGSFWCLYRQVFPCLFWIPEAPGIPCLLTSSFHHSNICFCHHIPPLPSVAFLHLRFSQGRTFVITCRSHLVNPWYAPHFKILNLIASISPFCLTGWHI